LTVSVAGERLAIPANDVAEVIRHPAVTRLPLSPPGLIGIANLRGTVIPIVSLAALLGRKKAETASRRVVVVGTARPVGLTVDDVLSLEQSNGLRSAKDPVRFIDVEALISKHFGAAAKPATPAGVGITPDMKAAPPGAAATQAFFSGEIAGPEFARPL
jgi:purine-binding chemotaxis protein CheW